MDEQKRTSAGSGIKPMPQGVSPGDRVMQIEVHSGRGQDARTKLYKFHKSRVMIGSAHSCDIRIQENAVSNVHAVIEMEQDGVVHIYDMASESGVFVNEAKTVTHELRSGDEIKIGFSRLKFRVGEVEDVTRNIPLPVSMKKSGEQRLYFNEEEDFAPLILEDERDVVEIFDYTHSGQAALQVAMYWGETIIDIQHHVAKEAIWIGQDRGVDFVVPDVPNAFPFITVENGTSVLHFTENMSGVIRSGNQLQSIDDLKEQLRASPSGLHRTVKQNDLVKIQIRDITLFVSYTQAPPMIRRRKLWDRDYLFMRMWFTSLALTLAFVALILASESPEPLEVDELPPQVTTIIFKPPPPKPVPLPKVVEKKLEQEVKPKPEPVKKPEPKPTPMVEPKPEPKVEVKPKPQPKPTPMVEPPKPEPMPVPMLRTEPTKNPQPNPTPTRPMATPMTQGAPDRFPRPTPSPKPGTGAPGREGEGAKAKGPEGERGRPDAPKADFKQSKGTMKPNTGSAGALARGAGGQGNVETIAQDLTGAISQALSGGSKGIRAASGKMRGYGGFDTQGGGGLGEIGTGSGGGGQSMDVAGLGTKGLGAGKVGSGAGAIGEGGHLAGGRSRPSIQVGDSSETVIMGGLDKDVIDKIIRQYFKQIQYCYEREINAGNAGARGRVMTRFVISSSGRVSSAAVASSSLGSANVHNCLTSVLKRIIFPEPLGGGIVEVSYPFVFSPSTN